MSTQVDKSRLRLQLRHLSSLQIAVVGCALIVQTFMALSSECRHWFVVPVFACGITLGRDVVDWLRGRLDTFDPVGLIGLIGVHAFFLAPLVQASQQYWMESWTGLVEPPADWRPWVGAAAALNAVGLVLYRIVVPGTRRIGLLAAARRRRPWRVDWKVAQVMLLSGMALSLMLQAWVYWQHGGILAYAATFTRPTGGVVAQSGWGRLFVLSESLPVLAAVAATWGARRPGYRRWSLIVVLLAGVFAASFVFGGLRGSRSTVVWTLFIAVGLVHFFVRPVSRRAILAGLVCLLVFVYGYGFFKFGGVEQIMRLADDRPPASAEARAALATRTAALRTLAFDLSRSNLQAYTLYRQREIGGYQYAYGRTYLGALALVVPRSLWPQRPPPKNRESTELILGRGSFKPGRPQVNWIYGLGGEAMLNFGAAAVPLAFVILGLLVGWTRNSARTLDRDDSRRLLLPFLVAACVMLLMFDSNNLVVFCVRFVSLPFLVIVLSRRLKISVPVSAPAALVAAKPAGRSER